MAIDNLNFGSAGLPAGQQTDNYSNKPGCLKSKNLDIFSTSKSVKATARSEATVKEGGIVDVDHKGRFELHENCRVYDRQTQSYITGTGMNKTAIYAVNYGSGTEDPENGTPQKLLVEYHPNNEDWKTIVVITSTMIYTFYDEDYRPKPVFYDFRYCSLNDDGSISLESGKSYCEFSVSFDNPGFGFCWYKLKKVKYEYGTPEGDVSIEWCKAWGTRLGYNSYQDKMESTTTQTWYLSHEDSSKTFWGSNPEGWIFPSGEEEASIIIGNVICCKQGAYGDKPSLRFRLNNVGSNFNGKIRIEPYLSYGFRSTTTFLPRVYDRIIKQFGDWCLISNKHSGGLRAFEPVYSDPIVSIGTSVRYEFLQELQAPRKKGEEFVDILIINDVVYKFSNNDGVGYITSFSINDPSGENAISIRFPGKKFLGAVNLNYIIYIIAEDRGVSGLYGYSGQELVPIITGNQRADRRDLLDNSEQFRFKKIDVWRGSLIMSTTDNRLFMYGDTFGTKGMSVIYRAGEGETIQFLTPTEKTLKLTTRKSNTDYEREYLDNHPMKRYLTDWEAVYPIIIGNHILEKEECDLFASYILPNADCKLEFWGMANHYLFWTFRCVESITIDSNKRYKIRESLARGDYYFEFLERNGNRYTFRLVGDLPYVYYDNINWNSSGNKIEDLNGNAILTFRDLHHFKKIGEVKGEGYTEDYIRFTNINNLLEFPKTHTLQVMVRGMGTIYNTPELFSLNLVANQRNRG